MTLASAGPFVGTKYGVVTPSDTVPRPFNALWIGGAGSGNLSIVPPGGTPADAVQFPGVGVGPFAFAGDYIMATGTDVTNIRWVQ